MEIGAHSKEDIYKPTTTKSPVCVCVCVCVCVSKDFTSSGFAQRFYLFFIVKQNFNEPKQKTMVRGFNWDGDVEMV